MLRFQLGMNLDLAVAGERTLTEALEDVAWFDKFSGKS